MVCQRAESPQTLRFSLFLKKWWLVFWRNGLENRAAITKQETRLKLEFVANADHTIHAGLVVIEAMARRLGLWKKTLRARLS